MTNGMFRCSGSEVEIIPEAVWHKVDFDYMDARLDAEKIATLAWHIKQHKGEALCALPFCQTVEAEALGAAVIDDSTRGNRIARSLIKKLTPDTVLKSMDFENGRIGAVLTAAGKLKKSGETVRLDVLGPVSLLGLLMDSSQLYKAFRKDRMSLDRLIGIVETELAAYMIKAAEIGVDILSFADPTGAMDIVGEKFYTEVSGPSAYRLLKENEGQLGKTVVHLCGKTSVAFASLGYIETQEVAVHGQSYGEAVVNLIKSDSTVRYLGHGCMKAKGDVQQLVCCTLK